MSVDGHHIGLPSLQERFSAVAPDVQNVVPEIAQVGMNKDAANNPTYADPEVENNVIDAAPDVTEQMSGVDAYLNNPGNTSILGECFAQGMKMGSDTVGKFSNTLNENSQPQQIIASIDNGQEMDVTAVAKTWEPDLTPASPFSSYS